MKNLVERLKKDKRDIFMFAIMTIGFTIFNAYRYAWTNLQVILSYYVITVALSYALSIFFKHYGKKLLYVMGFGKKKDV